MNLVKKLFKHNDRYDDDDVRGGGRNENTRLARRPRGFLGRRDGGDGFGIDREIDRLWRDFDRDPFSLMRNPWSVLDRMSERLHSLTDWPAIDISEDEDAMIVRCDVPGLSEKDLDVQVSGNLLTISGRREDEWKDRKRGVRRHERVSGSFSRTISVPDYFDVEKIDAKYHNGTLTLTLPRIAGKGPKRVQVTAA